MSDTPEQHEKPRKPASRRPASKKVDVPPAMPSDPSTEAETVGIPALKPTDAAAQVSPVQAPAIAEPEAPSDLAGAKSEPQPQPQPASAPASPPTPAAAAAAATDPVVAAMRSGMAGAGAGGNMLAAWVTFANMWMRQWQQVATSTLTLQQQLARQLMEQISQAGALGTTLTKRRDDSDTKKR